MNPRIRLKPSWPGTKLHLELLDHRVVPTISPDQFAVPGTDVVPGIVDPQQTPEQIGESANGTSSTIVSSTVGVTASTPAVGSGASSTIAVNPAATPEQVGEPANGTSSTYVEAVAQIDADAAGHQMVNPAATPEQVGEPANGTNGEIIVLGSSDSARFDLSGGSYTTTDQSAAPSTSNESSVASTETAATTTTIVFTVADRRVTITAQSKPTTTVVNLLTVADRRVTITTQSKPETEATSTTAPTTTAMPTTTTTIGDAAGVVTPTAESPVAITSPRPTASRAEPALKEIPHAPDNVPIVVGNSDSFVRTVSQNPSAPTPRLERGVAASQRTQLEPVPSTPMGTEVEPPPVELVEPPAVPTPELENPVGDTFADAVPLPLPTVEGAVPSNGRYVPFEPSAMDESIQRFMTSLKIKEGAEGGLDAKAITALSVAALGLGAVTTAYTRREQIKQCLPKSLTLSRLLTKTRSVEAK